MKSSQALAILLAFATSHTVLAAPAPAPQTDDAGDGSINHAKLLSDQLVASDDSNELVAADSKCISVTFSSSNPNWHYKFNGGWGEGSGNVGSLGTKSLCGSGAMFVGEQSPPSLGSAAGGNTKLEGNIVGDGKPHNVFDISVVDGYSLSMHCTGFGTGDIGGTQNLFNLGNCPHRNNNGPTCVNDGGHSNTAAQFFKNGGKYWYQDNNFQAVTFGGTPAIHCAISP